MSRARVAHKQFGSFTPLGWDGEILRDMFNIRDQQCIRRINLSENSNEVVVYWGKELSGQYTVHSAYRLLQAPKHIWRHDDENSIWQKTWRIKAPPKVLNFMWRSLSNCLPAMTMLLQKNVHVDLLCQAYRLGVEDVEYIHCHCSLAVQCWQSILPQVPTNNYNNLFQWWKKVMEACDNGKRA
ncbi:uncharacterized protein LOC141699867 [Apium graveolens]|uniref:uncharacterized protein LOC141699867 n=1 Tax=Apium graveolens TaxID=4045 RepID=UPI003D7BDD96